MQSMRRLPAVLVLTVLAVQLSCSYGVATVVTLRPAQPVPITQATPRAPSRTVLPKGVPTGTDPTPYRLRLYETPAWDPETTALVGLVTNATLAMVGWVGWHYLLKDLEWPWIY